MASQVLYPRDRGVLGNTGQVFIRLVPAIEIDRPATGAVYHLGQVINASWSCLRSDPVLGVLVQNCAGTVGSGSPIDTTPGTHRFTVRGISANGSEPVSSTVTYTVRSGRAVIYGPNLVTSKTDTHSFSVKRLSSGGHTVKLQVLLRSKHATSRRPKR